MENEMVRAVEESAQQSFLVHSFSTEVVASKISLSKITRLCQVGVRFLQENKILFYPIFSCYRTKIFKSEMI